MAMDASGRILVAGNDSVDRYLPSGALDSSFSATVAAPGSGANSLTAIPPAPTAASSWPGGVSRRRSPTSSGMSSSPARSTVRPSATSTQPCPGAAVSSPCGDGPSTGTPPPRCTVRLYADGSFRQAVAATTSRPDIGTAFPGAGNNRGFEVDLPLGAGNHSVCAEVVNQGVGANRWLGCQAAIVSPNPYGLLESASRAPGGVAVAGWAIDPDTSGVVSVQMYVDGMAGPDGAGQPFPPRGRHLGARLGEQPRLPLGGPGGPGPTPGLRLCPEPGPGDVTDRRLPNRRRHRRPHRRPRHGDLDGRPGRRRRRRMGHRPRRGGTGDGLRHL